MYNKLTRLGPVLEEVEPHKSRVGRHGGVEEERGAHESGSEGHRVLAPEPSDFHEDSTEDRGRDLRARKRE